MIIYRINNLLLSLCDQKATLEVVLRVAKNNDCDAETRVYLTKIKTALKLKL